MSGDKDGGGWCGQFSRGKEGIWRHDLEGGGGRRQVTWGRLLWREFKRDIIENVTNMDIFYCSLDVCVGYGTPPQ